LAKAELAIQEVRGMPGIKDAAVMVAQADL
jgi:hypothetical protein